MSKIVQMTVEIRTGLPNYSSRTTSAVVVADEDESLDIKDTARYLSSEINAAWEPKDTLIGGGGLKEDGNAVKAAKPAPKKKAATKKKKPAVTVEKKEEPAPEKTLSSAAADILG